MERDHTKFIELIRGICDRMNLQRVVFDNNWCARQIKRGKITQQHLDHAMRIYDIANQFYPDRCDLQVEYLPQFVKHENTYTICEIRQRMHESYIDAYGDEDNIMFSRTRYRNYLNEVYIEPFRDNSYYVIDGISKTPSIYLVIHWPEFTISNSKKQSLEIRDLFLRVKIRSDGSLLETIEGVRTTFTPAEFSVGYLHSHLPTKTLRSAGINVNNKLTYNRFCTGNGEIHEFLSYYNLDKTEGNLSSYLLMLDSMVKHESIDGGPHCLMEHVIIKNCNIPPVQPSVSHEVLSCIMRRIWGSYETPPLDWTFSNGRYSIIDNSKFDAFFKPEDLKVITLPDGVRRDWIIVYKDDAGNYYTPSKIEPDAVSSNEYLPFRGQAIKLVVNGEINFNGERTPYINPLIKQYVKQHLEHTANKIEIRDSCTQRLSQSGNNRGVSA